MSRVSFLIDLPHYPEAVRDPIFVKTVIMLRDLPFDLHAAEYDAWFEKHPAVFESELAAIREAWPRHKPLKSLEIGTATGRFAHALEITEGLEPFGRMCEIAEKKGVQTFRGAAEDLPYGELQFDVVLMNCISCLESTEKAFQEAYRVLKAGGCLLVPFIDKDSKIGQYYESRRNENVFYRHERFYSPAEVEAMVRKAGFTPSGFSQTLFNDLNKITVPEPVKPGYGEGSYVVAKAVK
jgi:SAM-dependent methyltransferase